MSNDITPARLRELADKLAPEVRDSNPRPPDYKSRSRLGGRLKNMRFSAGKASQSAPKRARVKPLV